MAARVMGIYTVPEGMALAILPGGREKRRSRTAWFPSFEQPDGTRLYPAEEIHKWIKDLDPDVTCAFDTAYPVIPLTLTLPKMRPEQVYQALRIELESRSVMDLMDPAVGFCPGEGGGKRQRSAGTSGVGLALERSDLKEMEQRYRPFGITPDLVTLPILSLILAFLREDGADPALLFLLEGPLVMLGVVRDRRIHALEVFYGGEAALADRLGEWLAEMPDLSLYGFEAVDWSSRKGEPELRFSKMDLSDGEMSDREQVARMRRPLSRETLAVLLAHLPSLVGNFEYGGVHSRERSGDSGGWTRKRAGLALGLMALLLLGIGGAFGILAGGDRWIYRQQRAAVRRTLRSVFPHVPPVGGTAIIEARKREYARLRSHIKPMLTPSTLALPMKGLPFLDTWGGLRILSLASFPDHLKVVVSASRPIDTKKLGAAMARQVGLHVEWVSKEDRAVSKAGQSGVYTLLITNPKHQEESRRVE